MMALNWCRGQRSMERLSSGVLDQNKHSITCHGSVAIATWIFSPLLFSGSTLKGNIIPLLVNCQKIVRRLANKIEIIVVVTVFYCATENQQDHNTSIRV